MAKTIQFDSNRFEGSTPLPPHCLACEAMLADALDGTLGPVDKAWFDRHIASCGTCADRFADAQRGAAWLGMLKSSRPEPRPELLNMILAHVVLAHVEGEAAKSAAESVSAHPLARPALVPHAAPMQPVLPANLIQMRAHGAAPGMGNRQAQLPARGPARPPAMMRFGRFEIESRLAMTAAMAFFSVALTLNLTGVRFNEIKASSLTPTGIRRSFYETNARVVRYYDNLRTVQMVEARVDTLRTSNDDQAIPSDSGPRAPESAKPEPVKPEPQPDTQSQPAKSKSSDPGPGSYNAPPAVAPDPNASPISDRRTTAQPQFFVSPAWLRSNAGDLV